MKCEDLLRLLSDHIDGAVDPAVCAEFERHMAGCDPCRIVIDNVRRTITLYKEGEAYELPVAFRERLHAALREKWKALGGKPAPPAPPASPGGA